MQSAGNRERILKREDAFLMVKLLKWIEKHDIRFRIEDENAFPKEQVVEEFLNSEGIKIEQTTK